MPVTKTALTTMGVQVNKSYINGLKGETPIVAPIISQTIPMNTKTVESPITQMVGPLREWIGPRHVETVRTDAYSITAKSFEKTLGIDREAVEDDNVGVYMPQFQDLGIQARLWPDQQLAAKLETGEADSCYDGTPFFGTAHPVDTSVTGGATFSNFTSGAGPAWYLLDTTKAIKPMVWGQRKAPNFVNLFDVDDPKVFWEKKYFSGVDARGVADYGFPQFIHKAEGTLNATNYEAAEAAMLALQNGAGENLGVVPDTILVSTANKAAAEKLFENRTLSTGEDNRNASAVKIVCWHRLAN